MRQQQKCYAAQMKNLGQLRAALSSAEVEFLDYVYAQFVNTGKATDGRLVLHKWGTDAVAEVSRALGGDIVQEGLFESVDGFRLTLVGMLLNTHGEYDEDILVRFLAFVLEEWNRNPLIEGIDSQRAMEALGINEAETTILGRLLSMAFGTGLCVVASFFSGKNEWAATVQRSVVDLKAAISVKGYVESTLLRRFSREAPVQEKDRQLTVMFGEAAARENFNRLFDFETSPTPAVPPPTSFAFMADSELRDIAKADWIEISATMRVEAWKATIIMCGSVIEAMLLDKFEDLANAKAIPMTVAKVRDHKLFKLIELSETHKVLPENGDKLAHFVRSYRNQVHPDAQRGSKRQSLKVEANLAFWVTSWISQELEMLKKTQQP
jgi:hypothetical protein